MRAERPELLLYADATPQSGAGHVMRLANLAEAWIEEGRGSARFAGRVSLPFVRERLASLGVELAAEFPLSACAGILVVDSYDTGLREWYAALAGPRLRVLVDDLGGEVPTGYDLVWNPNAYGSPSLYPGFTGEVLTGAAAVPVRRGLPRWSGGGSEMIGVMLGGGEIPGLVRQAVVQMAGTMGETRFRGVGDWVPATWERVPRSQPWAALAGCDLLVTAAGSTVWEAAAVGIPVVVVQTAANQERVCQWVRQAGAPVLDATRAAAADDFARALRDAASHPLPLPEIASGAARVARTLRARAAGTEVGSWPQR